MVDGPLRGIRYYRTSTEQENEKDARITIDQQKPLVEVAFKAFGINDPFDPIKDRAISGENFDDRPGLERIEELAEAGEINVLVVSDIDRLGRVCEKTIEFVKRLRHEYDVYIVANVRWYDVSNGDDPETFNAKAGRAEAENKKRGGRGNRGKLGKIVENRSDSYLSWFKKVPMGMVESNPEDNNDKGITIANDPRSEIPGIVLRTFMDIDADKHVYAKTEEKVRESLEERFGEEFDVEFDVKEILTNPIYTGRAVITIREAKTHSVDQAQMSIDMSDLRLLDDEEVELWKEAQEKIERITERNQNKTENRPYKLLYEYGPELIDDVIASWTLICPECGSTGLYEYYGTTTDVDGTKRQKCKCHGGDEPHFLRIPTRDEWGNFEERSDEVRSKDKD